MMEIDLFDETNQLSDTQINMVKTLLEFAAGHLSLPVATEMSVTFVDNEHIKQLNQEYRGKDIETDVISFALEDEVEGDMTISYGLIDDPMPLNIGDIIISVEKAASQAEEFGHTFDRELGFLAVHGFLHLNGYDHMNEADEKNMFDLQKEILDAYGLKR